MDKRRYCSRNPRNPRTPKGMAAEETGNAAADGYTVRHREPLDAAFRRRRDSLHSEDYAAGSLMDENEKRWSGMYEDY